MMSHDTSGNSSGIVPWIVMGLSMGVGYFGLESLMVWYKEKKGSETSSSRKKKKKNRFHDELMRQVQQMGDLLSLSSVKTWFLRSWTLPVIDYNHDVLWGVFVAVLPREEDGKTNTNAASERGGLLAPEKANNNKKETTRAPSPENDVFLTLPPQLNPRQQLLLPPKPPTKAGTKKQERYLEMLLHNVSHTDLVLGLQVIEQQRITGQTVTSSASMNSLCLSRPRFSAFDMYCRKLLQALEADASSHSNKNEKNEAEIVLVPQYQRSQNDPRYTIQPSDRPHVSTGFCWKKNSHNQSTTTEESGVNPRVIPLTEALADLRVRGKDIAKIDPHKDPSHRNSCSRTTAIATSPTSTITDMSASWNMVAPAPTLAEQESDPGALLSKEEILVELKAVFFPLLATLLPRWHAQIAQKYRTQNRNTATIHKVLVLVTGVGTPRNWTHSITGNSTQALADLMELFLQKVYPDITVVKIHSDTNIFRYDDNILFVQQELMPTVNAYRDAHATQSPYPHEQQQQQCPPLMPLDGTSNNIKGGGGGFLQQLQPRQIPGTTTSSQTSAPFDVDWKKSFAVTLSFADGSPARTHAIQTALRIFRPTCFHIWQLKTFWHERKIVDDDVEVHSFEEMETSPALESSEIAQEDLASVVQEMKAFRQEMTETLLGKRDSSDIHSFWLRKTHKPVLAVLLVQSPGMPPKLYRGTNMEVSMPTGSLCAERNVIGTALASNPRLKREDLKCIAVLAVPQPPKTAATTTAATTTTTTQPGFPPRPPRSASIGSNSDYCGSCRSSRRNSWDESMINAANAVVTSANNTTNNNNNGNSTTMTGRQMRSESFDEREEDWMLSYNNCSSQSQSQKQPPPKQPPMHVEEVPLEEELQPPSTPMRQISLFSSESSNSLVDMIKLQNPLGVAGGGGGSVSGSPPRAKALSSSSSSVVGNTKEKRTIVRSNNHDVDLNPLRPCGACHEWLKKIAECNPYFQIVTFTDANCNGVYVTPCQE